MGYELGGKTKRAMVNEKAAVSCGLEPQRKHRNVSRDYHEYECFESSGLEPEKRQGASPRLKKPCGSHWHAKRAQMGSRGARTHRRKGIVFSSSPVDDRLALDCSLSVDTAVDMVNSLLDRPLMATRKDSHK